MRRTWRGGRAISAWNAGAVSVDMRAVKARKDAIVMKSRTGVEKWLRGTKGCTVFTGQAVFEGPNTVRVGDDSLEARNIFLNVGARPLVPKMPGVDSVPFLTSTSILDLEELPRHLVVVGGGYVGLEFAQMFRRFGSEVTVIDKNPRLAMHEDEDASQVIREIFDIGRDQRTPERELHSPGEARARSECRAGVRRGRAAHRRLARAAGDRAHAQYRRPESRRRGGGDGRGGIHQGG